MAQLPKRRQQASLFDFVFTERGPNGLGGYGIRVALRTLKPDGLLFSEMIGNLHHRKVAELFGTG